MQLSGLGDVRSSFTDCGLDLGEGLGSWDQDLGIYWSWGLHLDLVRLLLGSSWLGLELFFMQEFPRGISSLCHCALKGS